MKKNKKPKKTKLAKKVFKGLQFVKYASAFAIAIFATAGIFGIGGDAPFIVATGSFAGSSLVSKALIALHLV